MEVTRRNLIQILSAAPAVAQTQSHEHPTPATPPATPPPDEARVQVHALIDRLTPEALVA